ncbi:MAG: hypothetical protein JO044_08655 [Mycobacteriaceae bacterium]|nr:hypothetical protein [Mycobacteriaceae bacterium]
MSERTSVPAGRPVADVVGTSGLFLCVTAVIALAVCVGGVARGDVAAAPGILALVSFAVSMACFAAQGRWSQKRAPVVAPEAAELTPR